MNVIHIEACLVGDQLGYKLICWEYTVTVIKHILKYHYVYRVINSFINSPICKCIVQGPSQGFH